MDIVLSSYYDTIIQPARIRLLSLWLIITFFFNFLSKFTTDVQSVAIIMW